MRCSMCDTEGAEVLIEVICGEKDITRPYCESCGADMLEVTEIMKSLRRKDLGVEQ